MSTQEYIEKMKEVQNLILQFLHKEENEINVQDIIKLLNENIIKSPENFKSFLNMLSRIANNHYKGSDFYDKISEILSRIDQEIKQTFSNFEIFKIFKNNKRMILLLIECNLLQIDAPIVKIITNKKYSERNYPEYFFNEIKQFISDCLINELSSVASQDLYEEKRKNGQNDSYVCELIRKDSIDEFVVAFNKNTFTLQTEIPNSIFETNPFLINKRVTLFEYSAFFGSIQIFQFLRMNGVGLSPSLWPFAIHSNSPEMIHLLEDNHVVPEDKMFNECLKESIKCHHNSIVNYVKENLFKNSPLNNRDNFKENLISYAFHYFNFAFLDTNGLSKDKLFYYSCLYNNLSLVKILVKTEKIDVNGTII